jgi:serine protease
LGKTLKALTVIVSSLFLIISVKGQDYYYSNNERNYLNKAGHWFTVQVKEADTVRFRNMVLGDSSLRIHETLISERGIFWLEQDDSAEVEEVISMLREAVGVVRSFPGYYNLNESGDTMHYIMTDIFNVQFGEHVTEEEINDVNEKYSVEIINRGLENEFMLRLKEESAFNTLEISNIYYENGLTAWSLPDFHVRINRESVQPPFFTDQWYLYNTGQGGGIAGLDINIVPAWEITKGSSDIIVAVIDEGVDDHEGFYDGQLITGYNAVDKSNDGSPYKRNSHGQAVAGIIAANHGPTGVRGVAPNVRIMSVRIEGARVSDQAAAFDTAWVRGADIINLSWGWSSYFDNIAQALQRAMTNGRKGKGTIVVKSAGNTYGGDVSFPGNVPGVLTVGAVTSSNKPARYTPVSDRVDLVAPSGDRRDKKVLNIITIDRHEPYGYEPNSRYYHNFDGTSAAAPQVSGVAALILSLNPDLTEAEVRDIITRSATSYGETDWAGAGRLNAYNALFEVAERTGPSIVRTASNTYSLGWIPSSANISWTFSRDHVVSSSSGTGTLANIDGSESEGTLTFTIVQPGDEPQVISKSIVVR